MSSTWRGRLPSRTWRAGLIGECTGAPLAAVFAPSGRAELPGGCDQRQQHLWKLCDVGGDPPRLVAGEEVRRRAPTGLLLRGRRECGGRLRACWVFVPPRDGANAAVAPQGMCTAPQRGRNKVSSLYVAARRGMPRVGNKVSSFTGRRPTGEEFGQLGGCRRQLCWNSVTRSPAFREYPVRQRGQLADRWALLPACASHRPCANVWSCEACGYEFETSTFFPALSQASS